MDDFRDHYDSQRNRTGSERMAFAALITGIAAVFLFWIFYLAIPMAAIAIILALLSRGNSANSRRGKLAVIIASVSIFLSASATGYVFYQIQTDPVLHQQFKEYLDYFERLYSEDLEAPLQEPSPGQEQNIWTIEGGEKI